MKDFPFVGTKLVKESVGRGVAVPEDIMIAGFGGFDIADVSFPGLTTIDARSPSIGEETGKLLVRLLRGDQAGFGGRKVVRIEPSLRISGSTGGSGV